MCLLYAVRQLCDTVLGAREKSWNQVNFLQVVWIGKFTIVSEDTFLNRVKVELSCHMCGDKAVAGGGF